MTLLCSGGTSSPRSGFAESLFVGPAAIAALLNNIPTPWAVALAGFIGHVTYNLSTFCTTDPPTLPTFSAQDVADLINVYNPVVNVPAAAKFQDLVGYYLWFQVCQCDSVATPAPSAPPSDPGAPDTNPPLAPPVFDSGACTTIERVIDVSTLPFTTGTDGTREYFVSSRFGLPAGPDITASGFDNPFQTVLFPAGATHYRWSTTTLTGHPGATTAPWSLSIFNSAGTLVGGNNFNEATNGGTTTSTITALPTGFHHFFLVHSFSGNPTPTADVTLEFFCTTTTPRAIEPCCPPDPILDAQLQQILGLVTLIQRQLAPFAYVVSATHSGLTGSGSMTVQGLLGARIVVTAHSAYTGEELADPALLFEAGWINWGDADGVTAREFIQHAAQVSFPAAAGQFTSLHYTLPVGVTIDIQELTREA